MASQAPPSDNLFVADLPPGFDDAKLKAIFGAYGVITQSKVLSSTSPASKAAALIRFQSLEEAQWIVENLNGNIPQGLTEPVIVKFADTPEMKAQRQVGGYGKAAAKGGAARPTPYGLPAAGFQGTSGKNGGGKGFAGGGGKGFGKGGKGGVSIKVLYNGLCAANALPGGSGYVNDDNALYVAGLPFDTQDVDLYKIFAPFGAIAPRGVRAMQHQDGSCKGFGFVNFMDATAAATACTTLNGTQLPDGTVLTVKIKSPSAKDMGTAGITAEQAADLAGFMAEAAE